MAASVSRPEAGSRGERFAGRSVGPLGSLTKRPEFLAVAAGRRFHTPRMSVQSIMRPESSEAQREGVVAVGSGVRVGLTVTKKVGHAPERNRIRRRLREAVIAAHGGWPRANLDIVIVGRRDALSAPFAELVEDLSRAVLKLAADKRPLKSHPPRASGDRGRTRGRGQRPPSGEPVQGSPSSERRMPQACEQADAGAARAQQLLTQQPLRPDSPATDPTPRTRPNDR